MRADWPSSAGAGVHVVLSSVIEGQALGLRFIGLGQADLELLRDHWHSVRGGLRLFQLPAEVWAGESDPASFTPAGYGWRYIAPPAVEEDPTNDPDGTGRHLFDVSVSLGMVPSLGAAF